MKQFRGYLCSAHLLLHVLFFLISSFFLSRFVGCSRPVFFPFFLIFIFFAGRLLLFFVVARSFFLFFFLEPKKISSVVFSFSFLLRDRVGVSCSELRCINVWCNEVFDFVFFIWWLILLLLKICRVSRWGFFFLFCSSTRTTFSTSFCGSFCSWCRAAAPPTGGCSPLDGTPFPGTVETKKKKLGKNSVHGWLQKPGPLEIHWCFLSCATVRCFELQKKKTSEDVATSIVPWTGFLMRRDSSAA